MPYFSARKSHQKTDMVRATDEALAKLQTFSLQTCPFLSNNCQFFTNIFNNVYAQKSKVLPVFIYIVNKVQFKEKS